jgi:hypothetical protein
MDVVAEVLDRVRFGGTLLFHFELGHPWNLALPARPYALFHYLSRGSATLALEQGRDLPSSEGDFVVVTRGEAHLIYSDRRTKPFPLNGLRSTDRTSWRRSSRRRCAADLDHDLRQFRRVATFARRRVGTASARASAETDGGRRLAQGNSATHGERVGA